MDFSYVGLVHGDEPGPGTLVLERTLDVGPTADEACKRVPRREVSLAGDPEDTQAMLPEEGELSWLGPDPLVASDHSEASSRNRWNPHRIDSAERDLWNEWVARMDDIAPRHCEHLAEAERAFVNE
ncbi:MAG: hypothetical protein M5U27_17170 [Gaiella sp.]|nr:hypothetical protein [Gaiella sp.]